MKAVTNLGSGWFLWGFGLLVVFGLARAHRRREALLFAVAVLGAAVLDEAMKVMFHRPRPDPFFGYEKPITYSFPSGHAFVSYCFYLALAEVLVEPEWPRPRRLAVWLAAILLILTIGVSRDLPGSALSHGRGCRVCRRHRLDLRGSCRASPPAVNQLANRPWCMSE